MTAEQARAQLAAMPSDAEAGRDTAKRYWQDGSWAWFYVSGYDFARLFGRTWEEAFWRSIEALKVLDPEKAAADLALATEKYRRQQLAEEEERRRKAEARKAKKRVNPQVKKNPLLPVAKVLPLVNRWGKQATKRNYGR